MKPSLLFALAAGAFVGLAAFNVQYARGTAYLQDDPARHGGWDSVNY